MMNATNEEDPFLQVQADVLAALSTTRPLFTSYLRIRSLPSSSATPSPELLSAQSELTTALTSLAEDLADLIASVQAVQADPYRYGLEVEEVVRRQRVVDEIRGEVEDMREELASTSSQHQNQIQNQRSISNPNLSRDHDHKLADEDYNAAFQQQQQLQILRAQDADLDSVFHTVGNLRQQADHMGRELEEQAEMLVVVDGLADRVGGRLQTGMKRMGEVVRANEESWSGLCIWVLVGVLLLLLVLILIL
ncbi:syntaxin 6 [Diplocarpon rosae]|nr:syntaxin 6 [Diplocarpon rosae]